jgi:hypothetical protein
MYLDNGSKRDGDALRKLLGVDVLGIYIGIYRYISVSTWITAASGMAMRFESSLVFGTWFTVRRRNRGEAFPSSITRYCDEACISVYMTICIIAYWYISVYIGICGEAIGIYRYISVYMAR